MSRDNGVLYGLFDDDGSGAWLPLIFGSGPLGLRTDFIQADVCVRTRQAGDLLGATKWTVRKMSRPTPSTVMFFVP